MCIPPSPASAGLVVTGSAPSPHLGPPFHTVPPPLPPSFPEAPGGTARGDRSSDAWRCRTPRLGAPMGAAAGQRTSGQRRAGAGAASPVPPSRRHPRPGLCAPAEPCAACGPERGAGPSFPGEWPRFCRIYRAWAVAAGPGRIHPSLPPCPPPGAGDWSGRSRRGRLAPGITCGGAGPEPGPGWAGLGTAERSRGGHTAAAQPLPSPEPRRTPRKGPRPPRRPQPPPPRP